MPKNVQILTLGDKLKRFFLYLAILFVVSILAFSSGWLLHRHDNHGGTFTITGNPSQSQINHAEYVIGMDSHGHAMGTAQIKPAIWLQSGEHSFGLVAQDYSLDSAEGPNFGNVGSFTATGPLSGNVQTTITDRRTGKELWSGSSPLTGTVTAVSDGQTINYDATFDNTQTFAIDLPDAKPKRFEVGAIAGISTKGDWAAGGYGRYNIADWNIGPVEVQPWAGVAVMQTNDGTEGWFMAGISGKF